MAEWYVRNDDDGDDIGPMAFDEVVARMREGSITPDMAIYGTNVTTGWQAARDVDVVGPLLEAVAAGRPSGCHWQRFHRRLADGTLRQAMFKSKWGPWLLGLAVFFGLRLWTDHQVVTPSAVSGWLGWGYAPQPGHSPARWLSLLGEASVAILLAFLAQISWYFIADIGRDRRARIATRTSASGARQDEQDVAIFVYELTPKVRGQLEHFGSTMASPTDDYAIDDYAIAPPVAHADQDHEDDGRTSTTRPRTTKTTVL